MRKETYYLKYAESMTPRPREVELVRLANEVRVYKMCAFIRKDECHKQIKLLLSILMSLLGHIMIMSHLDTTIVEHIFPLKSKFTSLPKVKTNETKISLKTRDKDRKQFYIDFLAVGKCL